MFRYRLHGPDGDDLGEATYAMIIKPGEEIHLGAGQRFRVVNVGGGRVAVRRAATGGSRIKERHGSVSRTPKPCPSVLSESRRASG
jgi:hypothetical protein